MRKQIAPAVYEDREIVKVKTPGKKIKDAVWEYRCDHCEEVIPDRYQIFHMFTPEIEVHEWDWGTERKIKLGTRDMTELCSPEHGALYIKALSDEFNVEFGFDFLSSISVYQMKKFAKAFVEAFEL